MKPIHRNLKILRESYLRISQTEFGQRFGLTRGQVDNYERQSEPRADILARISLAYNLELTTFLTLELTAFNMGDFVRDKQKEPLTATESEESTSQTAAVEEPLAQHNLLAWKGEVTLLLERLRAGKYQQADDRIRDIDRLQELTTVCFLKLSELYESQQNILQYVNSTLGK